MIRVLVTGSRGQVGTEVARALGGEAHVVAHDRVSLDLSRPEQIRSRIRQARPDAVVNASAYTAVDRAETDEDAAMAINGVAPGVMGEACREVGALLVHFSTDYVFDGTKALAYVETDAVNPLNAYGRTKLAGERAVAASGCDHVVLRTSWVYGPHGRNFMLTMLKLAQTRGELRIVDDQHGAPTSSIQLGALTRSLLLGAGLERARAASGLYHATAAGETTWCGFARAIFEGAARPPRVLPISSSEYPTPARRPANSVLSCARLDASLGLAIPDWGAGLEEARAALRAA